MTGIPAQAEFALAAGSVLQKRYLLGKNIRAEGDGFVYIAYDTAENIRVIVKEYFPKGIAQRKEDGTVVPAAAAGMLFDEGKLSFLRYARTLGRLREMSAVVNLYDIAEANGTCYMIFECVEGKSLREFVKDREERPLWEELRPVFMPLLATLVAMHSAGVGHYGVSPDNILVQANGKVKLVGYVIPECRAQRTGFEAFLIDGYAAPEQYEENGDLSEQTDLYAAAACLFFALTGNEIKSAPQRKEDSRLMISNAVLGRMPRSVATAMAGGLQLDVEMRTSTLDAFRSALTGMSFLKEEQPREAVQEAPAAKELMVHKKQLPNWAVGTIAFFVTLLVLSLAGWWYLAATNPNKGKEPVAPDTGSTSSEMSSGDADAVNSGTSSDGTTSVVISENEVLAPNLVDEPLETLEGSSAVIVLVESREFHDEVAEGCVISQSVKPETVIAKGSVISVVVSKGAKERVLPTVEGKTLEEAKVTLGAEGFRIGNITKTDAGAEKTNRVVGFADSKLVAGEKYEYGTMVDLMVGK